MAAGIVAALCLGAAASVGVQGLAAGPHQSDSHVGAAVGCPARQSPDGLDGGATAELSGWAPAAYSAARGGHIVVEVFAHVLRTAAGGGVPRSRILEQVKVLNRGFAGRESSHAADSPFRFRLADVDVTVRRSWYRMNEGSVAERHAKRTLHRGSSADLNLYIGENTSGALGWGTQPTRHSGEPKLDGIVIARHTMPGGRHGRYSAGDAAVHETGHWLGLFHTFTGGCSKTGDRVADTPREARPSYDCHVHRNTCDAPGNDPVHNFMDYGDDACMNQFTPGQVTRMLDSWERFRELNAT